MRISLPSIPLIRSLRVKQFNTKCLGPTNNHTFFSLLFLPENFRLYLLFRFFFNNWTFGMPHKTELSFPLLRIILIIFILRWSFIRHHFIRWRYFFRGAIVNCVLRIRCGLGILVRYRFLSLNSNRLISRFLMTTALLVVFCGTILALEIKVLLTCNRLIHSLTPTRKWFIMRLLRLILYLSLKWLHVPGNLNMVLCFRLHSLVKTLVLKLCILSTLDLIRIFYFNFQCRLIVKYFILIVFVSV